MPTWDRTVLPDGGVSPLWLPTGLRSRGHSGLVQLRNIQQVGWIWIESYNLLNARDVDHQALMAQIDYAWSNQIIWDIDHRLSPGSALDRNGQGTPAGAITVDGASQTGDTLNVAGFSNSQTNAVKAGDLISVESRVYKVRANASADGVGDVAIPVTPNVYKSPANGATVTISGVIFKAMVWERPKWPTSRSPSFYSGTITFLEIVPIS